MNYRADIDGIRALAILPVLMFHAFPGTWPGGFVGVDIFFVISGFLITSILTKDIEAKNFDLFRFYERRFKRLLPALSVVLFFSWIIGLIFLFDNEFVAFAKELRAGSFFTANFHFWSESGYFDSESERKPLLHLWSLSLEEQYYILWPVILFFAIRAKRKIATILALTLISFGLSIGFSFLKPEAAFFLLPFRTWELSVGALLSCLRPDSGILKSLRTRNSFAIIGLFLVLGSVIFCRESHFPGYQALAPVLGTALIIAAGSQAWVNRQLSRSLFVQVGLISYPLYLWHWPLLAFQNTLYPYSTTSLERYFILVLAVLLSIATYKWVEIPLRKTPPFKIWSSKRVLTASGIVLLIFFTLAQLSIGHSFKGLRAQIFTDDQDLTLDTSDATTAALKTFHSGCVPPMDAGIDCVSENRNTANIALIGDSHARSLFPGLAEENDSLNWLLIARGETPPISSDRKLRIRENELKPVIDSMIDRVVHDKDIRKVVIATRYRPYYSSDSGRKAILERDDRTNFDSGFTQGLAETLNKFSNAGKRVFLLRELPEFPIKPNDCLFRRPWGVGDTPPLSSCTVLASTYRDRERKTYNEVLSKLPDNSFEEIDVSDAFCAGEYCSPFDSRHALFSDTHHLNIRGARKAGYEVNAKVRGILEASVH